LDRKRLADSVDRQASVAFLADMIGHRSYSGTDGETALARFMVERMQALGLEARLHEVEPGRLQAIGWYRGTGGGRSLLFNGHIDTNPATEGWTVDPWGGVHDDEFIYGIGVSNMKAGDAAYFSAVRTLIENGVRLKGDVVLTFVVGELQGGVGTVKAIEDGIVADYFINAEPTDLCGLTLHAGAFNYVAELTGITRHVSKREDSCDALQAAAALVPKIDGLTFPGAANDEHRSVNRAHVGTLRAALSPEFHEWRPPQVADFARLRGTCRYAPSQSEDLCLEELEALLAELREAFPGLRTKVEKEFAGQRPSMLPFEVPRSSPVVAAIGNAHREIRGAEQAQGPVRPYCFYGTDAAHLQHCAGMEGIVCGPGGKYNTMPDERVEIADYIDITKMYILAMLDICAPA